MSSLAAWSYTAVATLWPLLGRADWTQEPIYGPPVPFACDYGSQAKVMRDDKGDEFTALLSIYTERAGIKRGDWVLIGASTVADPVAAGAREVRAVERFADTFERSADDYLIGTV